MDHLDRVPGSHSGGYLAAAVKDQEHGRATLRMVDE
jgi:hypothetical protein